MPELAVSDSTYRDQEELLFRTAAQLKGVVFYRGLLLILLPTLAWLSSTGWRCPASSLRFAGASRRQPTLCRRQLRGHMPVIPTDLADRSWMPRHSPHWR